MTDTASDAPTAPPVEGVPVTLNGTEIIANEGELIIDAAERNGVYIPRFCYHPRMKPVGMCRMCIVEVDTGRGPALQPSCMLECTPGMTVTTDSPVTKKAQDGVLEFLLINHPLDCPVCDKGGECPLQDQTMAYGPGESRFVEEKRHKEKPIPISDVVFLDRERCILCDRCTRFAKEVAGDPLIHFINRGNDTEVNTFPDEPFSSYFSGNTVQICPVGALTAKPFRFKARPWDLDQVESTCPSCSVGCRVAVQASRNEVLRYVGVDIDPVNWGWLCDKGRFGFEATNSEDRLRDPLMRTGDVLAPARWSDALRQAASAIAAARDSGGASRVAVIGGARLTNEAAYAWSKLARSVIGTDNVDCQLGDGLPADVVLGLPRATIDEVCRPGGTVILAGPDLKEELPVLFLRLRHAIVEDGVTVIELTPQPTGLSSLAAVTLYHRPGEIAETARALVEGLPSGRDGGGVDITDLLRARALLAAADATPTVVVGRQSIAESEVFAADAAASLFRGLPDARFLTALRRSNVHGALDMGLAPGFLPGRISLADGADRFAAWGSLPTTPGLDTTAILHAAAEGAIDVLVLLGADPVADFPDRDLAVRALANVGTLIAADLFLTDSSQQAHVVFPAAGFAEVAGTATNVEGRVSQVGQKVTPPGTARPDWMIAAELAFHLGGDLGVESVEAIWQEITELAPAYGRIEVGSFGVDVSGDGIVVPLPMPTVKGRDPIDHDATVDPDADPDATQASHETVQAEPAAADADRSDEPSDADEPTDGGADDTHPGPEYLAADDAALAASVHVLVPGDPVEPSALDAYGLRLIASRKLYDQGTLLQKAPSLAPLLPGTALRVSSYDFERLGVEAGSRVRVTSPKGEIHAEIAVDPGLPRGSAAVYVNQPGIDLGDLIDAGQRVTDLRIDSGERLVTATLATIFANDPMLEGEMSWSIFAIVLGKVVIVFALLLVATMFMIWFERKLHADMTNRIGPNKAGPFGILQTLADGIKFFFKEDLMPTKAEKRVFILAPFITVVPAFLLFSIIPIGGDFNNGNDGVITVFGHDTYMQLADPPIGILFALAMSSIAVYGIMLAGWSSGSKYPLLGSVRASAQMVSYEAAMALSVMAVILVTGSLTTNAIVNWQAGAGPGGFIPNWAVFLTGLVPFVIFVIAGTAELNRPPFDLVEAEQELVGGFNTEYSSIRFALFFVAEFMNVVTMSGLFVTMYLGGPAGPAPLGPGWLWGVFWFCLKVFCFLFMFVWFRATLPRFRYDQLMDFGWKLLIPAALGWLILLGAVVLAVQESWNPAIVAAGIILVGMGGYGLLRGAITAGHARHELESSEVI